MNKLITEWVLSIKLATEDPNSNECPYPTTGTLNTNIRTFFAALQNIYSWTLTADHLKGFPGNFHGNLKEEYNRRIEKWVSSKTFAIAQNTKS